MFVEEYLQDLRRERYAPAAWLAYARRVGRLVRADILANPAAVRSIWIVALGMFAAAFAVAVALALRVDRHLANEFFVQTSLTTLVSFILVTFYVGLLRNAGGFALSALTVPCVLTIARVVMLPGLALLLIQRRFMLALVVFVIAALTDVADGWAARRFHQETRLGTLMDPQVDIIFNLTLFWSLHRAGLISDWVWIAAAVRYGLLLLGGSYLFVFHGPVRVASTLFGKMAGVVMCFLVGLILLFANVKGPVAERLAPLTQTALGVLLVGAVGQVLVMGWYNLRLLTGEARAARRVIDDVRWGAS
jgi:cardiolipin synthase (CMP-forming)